MTPCNPWQLDPLLLALALRHPMPLPDASDLVVRECINVPTLPLDPCATVFYSTSCEWRSQSWYLLFAKRAQARRPRFHDMRDTRRSR